MPGDDYLLPICVVLLLGITGIVVWHVQGAGRPTSRLLSQLSFFAAMSTAFYLVGITPYRPDRSTIDGAVAVLFETALILWWTHLAWAVIGLLHIYVAVNRKPRDAHLVLDIAVALIYLAALLSVLAFVFEMPIATVVTTSGVVAIILGLALQSTLADVFSGMALTLGSAFAIGDWVRLSDGTIGRVVETNWRSTYLLTSDNNVAVLPNSMLAKQRLTSLSRPDDTHQIALTVRFAARQRPRHLEDAMRSVLQDCTMIIRQPAPTVVLKSIDALAIAVELQFRVAALPIGTAAQNEIIDLIYAACTKAGISLAPPSENTAVVEASYSYSACRAERPSTPSILTP